MVFFSAFALKSVPNSSILAYFCQNINIALAFRLDLHKLSFSAYHVMCAVHIFSLLPLPPFHLSPKPLCIMGRDKVQGEISTIFWRKYTSLFFYAHFYGTFNLTPSIFLKAKTNQISSYTIWNQMYEIWNMPFWVLVSKSTSTVWKPRNYLLLNIFRSLWSQISILALFFCSKIWLKMFWHHYLPIPPNTPSFFQVLLLFISHSPNSR